MAQPTLAGPDRDPWPDALWQYDEPNITTEINLGDEGLTDGDDLSSYVAQHKGNGVRLIIPEGNYISTSRSDLLELPGGDYHLKGEGGLGGVVVQQQNINEVPTLEVNDSNSVAVIENIDLEGALPNDDDCGGVMRVRETDSEIILKRFRMPDGQEDGSLDHITSGFYVDSNEEGNGHIGSIRLLWCEISNFSDNGLYADGENDASNSAGSPYYGRVIVVGGRFANNNISSVRLGNPYSTVYGTRFEHTESNGTDYTENYRGIWIREPISDAYELFDTYDVLISNCHFNYESNAPGGSPIRLDSDLSTEGGGVMEDMYINDGASDYTIGVAHSDINNFWDFDNFHISGSGVDVSSDVTLTNSPTPGSSSAESPDMTPLWYSSDVTGDDGSGDGGSGDDGSSDPESSFELTIETNTEVKYYFRATGEITPVYDDPDFPSDDETSPPGDYSIGTGDGSWVAIGHSGGSGGDTFTVSGDITEMNVVERDGVTPSYTLLEDGTEVSESNLITDPEDGGGDIETLIETIEMQTTVTDSDGDTKVVTSSATI